MLNRNWKDRPSCKAILANDFSGFDHCYCGERMEEDATFWGGGKRLKRPGQGAQVTRWFAKARASRVRLMIIIS